MQTLKIMAFAFELIINKICTKSSIITISKLLNNCFLPQTSWSINWTIWKQKRCYITISSHVDNMTLYKKYSCFKFLRILQCDFLYKIRGIQSEKWDL